MQLGHEGEIARVLERPLGHADLALGDLDPLGLEGLVAQITRKAGVDGRLFGSVTNADVAEALEAQGIKVVKGEIRMPQGPLKHVGEFPLTAQLHSDVLANFTVAVLGEQ